MNLAIECDVVLSKKLEAICESGESISLNIASVSGNKGKAILRLVCKDGVSVSDIEKIGETSLPIKILSIHEDVAEIGETRRFGNLIANMPSNMEGVMAVTTAEHPAGDEYKGFKKRAVEKPAEPVRNAGPSLEAPRVEANASPDTAVVVLAALRAAGLAIPQSVFDALTNKTSTPDQQPQQPQKQIPKVPQDNCIRTFNELIEELQKIPGIDENLKLPTDRKLTPREADALLSRMPRLRKKAFIRNTIQSQLMISDLYTTFDGGGQCLCMLPGAAYDLSRLPARNILNSTDFKWAFETGKFELVDSATYAACFKKLNDELVRTSRSELPVYSGEGMAEQIASGAAMADEGDSIHIGEHSPEKISVSVEATSDDNPQAVAWEENADMQALIGGMPTVRPDNASKSPRRM